MSNRSLIILAGGTSRRFQNKEGQWLDKVLMEYNNKPLLIHLLKECSRLYDVIGLSINSKTRKKVYSKVVRSYLSAMNIEYIIDSKKTNFEGVLQGIQSSMDYFVDKEIQFVPSDRPYLLFEILAKLETKSNGVSIFQYSDGMIEPLLALYGSNSRISPHFLNLSLSRADVPIRLAQHIQTYNIDELIEKNNSSYDIFANINVKINLSKTMTKHDTLSPVLPSPKIIDRRGEIILDNQIKNSNIPDVVDILMQEEHFYTAYLWLLKSLKEKNIDSKLFNKLGKEVLQKEREFWRKEELSFLELHALQDLVSIFPEEQTQANMSNMLQLKEKMKIKSKRVS